jgi:hypothetical protein
MFRGHRLEKLDIVKVITTVLSLLLGLLLMTSIGWYEDYQNIPKENLIGNRDSNASRLKEEGLPFSFLVIGDTHNSNQAKALIRKALKTGTFPFMIILGDFVNEPDLWSHRFFLTEMTREVPFPVFLVPGNHDIDDSQKIGQEERRVTPQIFEYLYGKRNFHFIFNDCLFIISGMDAKNRASYLEYLRDTLSKEAARKRHIFIFLHHPPKGAGMPAGSFSLPYEEDFFSLLEAYKVTSCFFGDFHSYWRVQRKGTNLIVSGGGGGRLKQWQPEWGKFHHILKITVDQDKITEGMIILGGERSDLSRTLIKWIFIRLFPVVGSRGWILYTLTVLFLSLGIYSVIIFSRRFLRTKGPQRR